MKNQVIQLSETSGIADIDELFKTLKPVLEKNAPVTMDASNITSIDTTSMQLLLSFSQKMQINGNKVKWQKPSEEFCRAAKLIGIESHLGLDTVSL